MVGSNTLKTYDFHNIEQYFDMIIESYINGQISQCNEQIKSLSNNQKRDFFDYLDGFKMEDRTNGGQAGLTNGSIKRISMLIINSLI